MFPHESEANKSQPNGFNYSSDLAQQKVFRHIKPFMSSLRTLIYDAQTSFISDAFSLRGRQQKPLTLLSL